MKLLEKDSIFKASGGLLDECCLCVCVCVCQCEMFVFGEEGRKSLFADSCFYFAL